jgi:hypothetical protein
MQYLINYIQQLYYMVKKYTEEQLIAVLREGKAGAR